VFPSFTVKESFFLSEGGLLDFLSNNFGQVSKCLLGKEAIRFGLGIEFRRLMNDSSNRVITDLYRFVHL
jgi:hypothetical protein